MDRSLIAAGLMCLMLAGCGSDVNRTDLAGKATFDGQPIVHGSILFVSKTGPAGTATIRNGEYNTAEGGQGITPGPLTIQVTAYDSAPIEAGGDSESGPADAETVVDEEAEKKGGKGPLFNGYTLEATVDGPTHDINVPAEAAGFDIGKAGGKEKSSGEGSDP